MMMRARDRSERKAMFNRRSLMLSAGGAAAFGALVARLWQLQVVEAEQYATRAVENQFNYVPLPPSRGRILDRYGAVIAGNHENYLVRFTPHQVRGATARREVLLDLAQVIAPRASVDRWNALVEKWTRRINVARAYDEVLLEADLDWATFSRVNLRLPTLPGVTVDTGEVRAYGIESPIEGVPPRDADAFAHVIGYVSKPNDEAIAERLDVVNDSQERSRLSRILRHPGYRIGRAGVEMTLDAELQGEWGLKQLEVDARGRAIREKGVVQQPLPGSDVRLTLDAEVQVFAQRRLEGESGAVAAIDVTTGEIICLVSAPAFDPGRFARGIETAAYRALLNDERKPLYNKPLAGLYPPGSTFKVVVALAALRAGFRTDERITCYGSTWIGDREFHCWKGRDRGGHGTLTMRSGIKNSCDCYFYEVARRVGVDLIAEEARRFGFEEDFALDAPGWRPGHVPTEAWKRARFNESWTTGETFNTGIGQGYVLGSPLELAVMTARIANGGMPVRPYIVEGRPHPITELPTPLADPEHIAFVKEAMMSVTDEPGGTAYSALEYKGIDIPGVRMAGKTGTSQVRRITPEERARGVISNADLPWRRRDHGLFIAFAPYDAPRYAIALIVEHGGGGSTAAAKPARDILRHILLRDPSRLAEAEGGRRG